MSPCATSSRCWPRTRRSRPRPESLLSRSSLGPDVRALCQARGSLPGPFRYSPPIRRCCATRWSRGLPLRAHRHAGPGRVRFRPRLSACYRDRHLRLEHMKQDLASRDLTLSAMRCRRSSRSPADRVRTTHWTRLGPCGDIFRHSPYLPARQVLAATMFSPARELLSLLIMAGVGSARQGEPNQKTAAARRSNSGRPPGPRAGSRGRRAATRDRDSVPLQDDSARAGMWVNGTHLTWRQLSIRSVASPSPTVRSGLERPPSRAVEPAHEVVESSARDTAGSKRERAARDVQDECR